MAEVDGNRTRRTGIARANRFEGGGAHQVLGHLPGSRTLLVRGNTRPVGPAYAAGMKKLVLIAVLVVLGGVAAKKARHV